MPAYFKHNLAQHARHLGYSSAHMVTFSISTLQNALQLVRLIHCAIKAQISTYQHLLVYTKRNASGKKAGHSILSQIFHQQPPAAIMNDQHQQILSQLCSIKILLPTLAKKKSYVIECQIFSIYFVNVYEMKCNIQLSKFYIEAVKNINIIRKVHYVERIIY